MLRCMPPVSPDTTTAGARRRLRAGEDGFTLLEVLATVMIIGVLLAIAVPLYLGFADRAERKAAGANVRAAMPTAAAYYADNGNSYSGMSMSTLLAIDSGTARSLQVTSTDQTYCISATQGGHTQRVDAPGGAVTSGAAC